MFAQTHADLASRDTLLSMPGLDFMRSILDGRTPQPPIGRVLGYRLTAVEPGTVTFTGTPGFNHLNPMGGVHGGWYGTLLDSAMACAVMTTLPAGRLYTTLEYKVSLLRALPVGTEVEAVGRVVHAGRTTGVAEGALRGTGDGRLYATGTSTCLVLAP